MHKRRWIAGAAVVGIVVVAVVAAFVLPRASNSTQPALKRVVINEAARTLLYLPLYHAVEKGCFKEAGLDVDIVTGGTATSSFAAMVSGEADFALADPMYVPISREKGSRTKIIAQVVGRIAFWGLTKEPSVTEMSAATLSGKKIATHPRPMSGYTYTIALIRKLGLKPDEDVEIIGSQPGTELGPLFNGQADFAITVEPNVSKAVAQGAHIVYSFPNALGDQVLSALMTQEDLIAKDPKTVMAVAACIQRALVDIRKDPKGSLTSATKRFAQVDQAVLRDAVQRLAAEDVFPRSVIVSEESWNRAIQVRVDAGDLRVALPRDQGCDLRIMQEAAQRK